MSLYQREIISGGPYDSTMIVEEVNGFPKGDRAIDAAFIASMIDSLITSGVIRGDGYALEVTPGEALTVRVSTGVAWARGYMARLDEEKTLELTPGAEFKVYIRQDTGKAVASLRVEKDDGMGNIPIRSATIYDLVLAVIRIPEGAEAITADMIEDRRDTISCGYVTSRI